MQAKPSRQLDKLRRTLAMMLGGLLAIVTFTVVSLVVARSRALPVLEPNQLAAAEAAWAANAPANYRIAVNVSGQQPALYRVHVKRGVAVSATRNDHELRDARTFSTWSVPGMFGTIGRDVETNQRAVQNGEPPPLYLRARFDPEHGIPRRYLRSDERQKTTTSWQVIEFEMTDENGNSP